MSGKLLFETLKPQIRLIPFVESIWMLRNPTNSSKEIAVLPDGRIDLFFSRSADGSCCIRLIGLETRLKLIEIPAGNTDFVISFHLPAVECMFREPISKILDAAQLMPNDLWGFRESLFDDFKDFCNWATGEINALLPHSIDDKKHKLFTLVYNSNGEMSIKSLAEQAFWESRQINRYFKYWFGIPLKAYCNIIRFSSSFKQLHDGELYPHGNFSDQPHFIREVKRMSGVSPRELNKNKNDRFIQLSVLDRK